MRLSCKPDSRLSHDAEQSHQSVAWAGHGRPIKRIQTLKSIMHELLWRNPRDVVERHFEVPEPLPQSAIAEGARIYADRKIMLGAIAKGLEVAEVK